MSIIAEPFKQGGENFPQNKIILTDGRELDCYPLAEQAPEELDHDPLELDKNGPVPRYWPPKAVTRPTAVANR